jgi:beta-lactam-binding protein with PASTA domain
VVDTKTQANDTVAAGKVFDSSPKPGENVAVGSHVTLIVSAGPAPVAVPDVSHQPQDLAIQQLQQAGFTSFQTVPETSDTIPAGSVTRTDPKAGAKAALDTRIKIFVSSGKPTVTVPPEIGKSAAEASTDLTAQGFTVSILYTPDPANVGLVVDQSPAAGSPAAPKSNVVLKVGKAPATSTSVATTTTGP